MPDAVADRGRECLRVPRWLTACALALVGVLFPAAQADARGRGPVVLFLHSYDVTYHWTVDQQRGATEALTPLGPSLVVRVEYLDARRERRPEIHDRTAALLAAKYATAPPQLIVASDDFAVQFLAAHPLLFAGVPVVFGGVSSEDLAAQLPRTRFTGVTEPTDMRRFVGQMVRLRPQTRRVFAVADNTRESTELAQAVRAVGPDHGVDVAVLSGEQLRFGEMLSRLGQESGPDDLVILRPVRVDVTGQPFDTTETTAAIVTASNAPVVSPNLSELGQGVLAGIASQGRQHGRLVGAKALAVLRGTPVERIPIEPAVDDELVFDVQQLGRWGLGEDDLPAGAITTNHPPSLYKEYQRAIWGGMSLLIAQTAIIGVLVRNVRSRRRAQRALEAKASELATSHHSLDLTHQALLREQEKRQHAEDSLRQSQKMEALGRLAGGVAHDFNNLLTIILGHSALLQGRLAPGSDAHLGAREIQQAGEQAATLTRQLLAFSRKQVVRIGPRDVFSALLQLEPLIRRLFPESVAVALQLDPTLPPVMIGEGQIEQIVLNLVANARDAMPEGGAFRIETDRVSLDGPLPADPDVTPGEYLRLQVSDTGHGMDAETQRRMFEPFFTTKAPGRGTGVGLATVYGIVKQHEGAIGVTSAPGMGTTMAIYLPLRRREDLREMAPTAGAR